MEKIDEYLKDFSDSSENIIDALKKEEYADMEDLLSKRGEILDKIKKLPLTKEQFKECFDKYNVYSSENKIINMIEGRKSQVRDKIRNLNKNKKANVSYNMSKINKINIFSKKV